MPNTHLHSSPLCRQKQRNIELKEILFIPSFAFSIAQLCKIKRRTTAIYRLADKTSKRRRVVKKNKEKRAAKNVD